MSSKKTAKRIYIDVTQAQNWQGRAAGIIRVMDEISSRFASDDRFEVTFLCWDSKNHYFYGVDFLEALKAREHSLKVHKSEPNPQTGNKLRKALTKVPLAKRTFHLVRNTLLETKKLPGIWRFTKKISIEPNSVLFMPHGGVWESKEYGRTITELSFNEGVKLVPILHDMCPIVVPQFCSPGIRKVFKRHMSKTLHHSSLALCVSNNTIQDATKWLKDNNKKIPELKDFRLGDNIGHKLAVAPKKKLPKDFILCVGTIEARKNHTSLYYSYKLAIDKKLEIPTLVIAGKRGWLAEDIYKLFKSDPVIKNHIILLKDTSDENLAWLYDKSMFTIYPSFYEGWGLPVAESLLHKTPVIASSAASIPEIGGDLVDYFSPYSPDEIMQKIHEYSSDKNLLKSKRQRILKEYKATTWDDSYKEVAEAILDL